MAFYNNPFYYQPPQVAQYGQQQTYAPQPQQQAAINDSPMIWVQGEAGAKAYPVAPNTTVVLWDSERTVIYIKRADGSGIPSLRYFDYTERSAAPAPAATPQADYITRKEFEEFKALLTKKEANDEPAV